MEVLGRMTLCDFPSVAYRDNVVLNPTVKDTKGCTSSTRRLSFWKAESHNANFKLVLEEGPTMALIIQSAMNRILLVGFYQCVILLWH